MTSADAFDPNERWAELVLVDRSGTVLGKLPAVQAAMPWWSEVETLVRAVRERFGVDVTILRLLRSPRSGMRGGHVTYLAQIDSPVECAPCDEVLDDHPLRNTYAQVGGPEADLDWARSVLAQHGLALAAPPVQIKTWNLSSLWRLPLAHESAWLKSVPLFFRHEGALIEALGPEAPVPRLVGHCPGRLVMRYIPGEDLFDATSQQRVAMLDMLIDLQRARTTRVDELLAVGVPDWRASSLAAAIESTFERTRYELDAADAKIVESFIAHLDSRFAALEACGIPDSLVHGDFHPGNVRGIGNDLTILDWGDAGVGHPLLDVPAFMERAPAELAEPLRNHWIAAWRDAYAQSDPARAWNTIAPLAAARKAVIYRAFLDNIEPSEHPYHRDDPRDCLRNVAEILRREG
jgi:Ser/Thr protein kinase RdoA (MazF antagonist)